MSANIVNYSWVKAASYRLKYLFYLMGYKCINHDRISVGSIYRHLLFFKPVVSGC